VRSGMVGIAPKNRLIKTANHRACVAVSATPLEEFAGRDQGVGHLLICHVAVDKIGKAGGINVPPQEYHILMIDDGAQVFWCDDMALEFSTVGKDAHDTAHIALADGSNKPISCGIVSTSPEEGLIEKLRQGSGAVVDDSVPDEAADFT